MSKVLLAALGAVLLVGVGCQSDSTDDGEMRTTRTERSETIRAAGDDCAMCPGVQTARADGTCPSCNMKTSSMDSRSR